MRGIIIALVITMFVGGGGIYLVNKQNPNSPLLNLPFVKKTAPKIAVLEPDANGFVLGSQASLPLDKENITTQSKLSSIGQVIKKIAQSLGDATFRTGQTLVENVTSTPSSQTQVINLSNVVKDVSNQVESIPSTLLNQAKIEYCRQVLEAATQSASHN